MKKIMNARRRRQKCARVSYDSCMFPDVDDNNDGDDCMYPRGTQYLQKLVGADEPITYSSLDQKTHILYSTPYILSLRSPWLQNGTVHIKMA